MQERSVTLLELLVVIIIIGILATLGFSQYGAVKERTLDKEAIANLKLIAAAERIYRMEQGSYYPSAGSKTAVDAINQNLKLSLSDKNWAYTAWDTGCSEATRTAGTPRSWSLTITDLDGEPDPVSGCQ